MLVEKTQKTPLYNQHLKLVAKMSLFANYYLPISYTSQIDEHNSVRKDAGMFDVSHMTIIDIIGAGTRNFLRYLMANDVAKLNKNQALYSCMLNYDGGVIDDLIIYKLAKDNYRIVSNATTKEKDIAWLYKKSKLFDVLVTVNYDLAIIALQGPKAIDKLIKVIKDAQPLSALPPFNAHSIGKLFIAKTGYTGEDGVEIMLPKKEAIIIWQELLKIGVKPCGLGARDTLRLEAGMCLYGNEMDDKISPLETGLSFSVDLSDKKRDFIGREKLLKLKKTGIKNTSVGVILKEKGIIRAGSKIKTNKGIGIISSGVFSPTLKKSIALARVPVASSNNCSVKVRNKWLKAVIVDQRFVSKGKILICS